MKKILLVLFLPFIVSCESTKYYEDYNEYDFYEVQGIIESVNRTRDPFDEYWMKNISYSYFIDRPVPLKGREDDLDRFQAKEGLPLVVLVHKDDENISFYGRVGIAESLNEKETEILKEYIKNELDNW